MILATVTFDKFVQLLISGISNGSFYALVAVGFGLIMSVSGRFHLAYAVTFVVAQYMAISFVRAGAPLYVGVVGGLLVAALLGVLIEVVIYHPLGGRSEINKLLAVFVSALGLTIVAENATRLIWGSLNLTLSTGFAIKSINLGPRISFTTFEIVEVVVAWVVVIGLAVYLSRSRQGRAILAVRANPEMASSVGISPAATIALVFAIGSVVCGIGGIIYGMHYTVSAESGQQPTLIALVATFLAGMERGPLGYAFAGLFLGVVSSLSNLWIATTWNSAVVFGILFIYIAAKVLLEGRSGVKLRRRWARLVPSGASG